MNSSHIKKSLLNLSPAKGSLLGIASSSSQNILHHKMQHTPFFPHTPHLSHQRQIHSSSIQPSEQPFRSAEVGTHCWHIPQSRSQLCPAPGGERKRHCHHLPRLLAGPSICSHVTGRSCRALVTQSSEKAGEIKVASKVLQVLKVSTHQC